MQVRKATNAMMYTLRILCQTRVVQVVQVNDNIVGDPINSAHVRVVTRGNIITF